MKWFNLLGLFTFINMVISFANIYCTDYTAGIIHYQGFLPEYLSFFLIILFIVSGLIYFGAYIENNIDR